MSKSAAGYDDEYVPRGYARCLRSPRCYAAFLLASVLAQQSPPPFSSAQRKVSGEGTHFRIPWLQTPHLFDIRMQPRNIASTTGTKDLQVSTVRWRAAFLSIALMIGTLTCRW